MNEKYKKCLDLSNAFDGVDSICHWSSNVNINKTLKGRGVVNSLKLACPKEDILHNVFLKGYSSMQHWNG